jgi:site-specific DNA recombinase
VLQRLARLQFNNKEKKYFQQEIARLKETWDSERGTHIDTLNLRVGQIQKRVARLTDAYIDQVVERELFEERKTALLMERMDVQEKLKQLKDNTQSVPDQLAEFLELAGTAYFQYKMGLPEEKRDLLKIVTSNRVVDGKKLVFTLSLPFSEVENRFGNSNSPPYRDIPRTWERLIQKLLDWFKANSAIE